MKKRLPVLMLCLALLPLPGCAAMLERSHVSSTAHVDYAVEEDESILRAETYQGLVNSMLYFVNGHRGGGTVRLYNYAGDVEADLAAARDAVLQDPVGAFAVGALSYDSTRILTYYEVKLTIRYTRSAREVEAIPEVTGLAGVRQELARLVTEQRGSVTFLASYFSGDKELVEKLLRLACLSAPGLPYYYSQGGGAASVALYPETGTRRVVEVALDLPAGAAGEEKEYAQQLETAAAALLEANPPAGEGYTVEELAAIVRGAHGGFDWYGTDDALGALSGEPVQVLGALMALEYLCQQCGIGVEPVDGLSELWLIVAVPEGFRHLLPAVLFGPDDGISWEDAAAEPFRLYTDQELIELGWEWDAALYPACGDEAAQALAQADGQ